MDHVENKRVTVVILLQSVVEPKMEEGKPQYDLEMDMVFSKANGSPSKRPGAGEPFALLKLWPGLGYTVGYLLPFWVIEHYE